MSELRWRAEKEIQKHTPRLETAVPQDRRVLVHELQAHQVELQMQNDELRRAQQELLSNQVELQAERERYRMLFDLAPEAYLVTDLRGRIQEANVAACRVLGREQGKLRGAALPLFCLERDMQMVRDLISEAREGRSVEGRPVEVSMRQGDRTIECEVTINEVQRTNGHLVGLRWLFHDIAQTKRTQALRRSEERYELAMQGAGVGLWDWDISAGKVYYSPRWKALFGYKEDEIGDSVEDWVRLLHPEERDRICEFQEDFLAGTEQRITAEYRLRHKDGAYRWIEAHAVVVRDESGKARRLVGSHGDITARKRAEEALRESEERQRVAEAVAAERQRLHDVLDKLPAYVILLSTDYHVSFANRFFEERFGKSNGRRCYEYLFNRAEPCENCETYSVLKTNAPHRWEWTGPDGRNYDIYDFPFTARDGSRQIMEVGLDITETKQAQMRVQLERQRFYDVLETLPAMICLLTPDYHVTFANRSFREKFGEARGRYCYEYCFGRKAPCEFCESYQVLKTGKPHQWEVAGPDGSVIAAYDYPFQDVDGSPLILEMDLDITEMRQAQAALKAAVAYNRSLIEVSLDPLVTIGPDGKITDVNQATEVATGFGRDALIGSDFSEYFTEPEMARAGYQQVFREGFVRDYPLELRHRDGRVTSVVYNASVYRDDTGRVSGVFAAARDITARKRAEEALREANEGLERRVAGRTAELLASETRLTQAIRVAGFGVFEHDHHSGVIEHSPLMRQMMGFGEREPIRLPAITERVAPDDREKFATALQKAHDPAGDGVFNVEFRAANREGRIRWVSARSQTFFEEHGGQRRPVRTIGAALDVTERREAQAELERLVAERTARLQELVGELEHFSYTITHDMRAPLRAMKGFGELVSEMCETWGNPEAQEFLRRIMTSADRMDALIRDALNYNRTVRQELPLEDVDTGALLRGMLDTYPEFQASKADIRVVGRLPVVLGNEAALTQCFSNLLGNAVKFVRPGAVADVRVWAEEREGGWARIWVEDKGIGISQAMLPRVFDMFSRGSRDYEGTGIGLALVRKVAQRMGGRVGVESEEGKGSRFWVELKTGEIKQKTEPGALPQSQLEGGTVLYVEDEESDAVFMRKAFASKGLESALRWVGSGRAAIDYLSGAGMYRQRKEYPLPTVVVLDLNLPEVPGFEVLKWMRNHPDFAATPVVVFSSSTREHDRLKARELGATEFLGKPKSGSDFTEVVQQLKEKWLGISGRPKEPQKNGPETCVSGP